MEQMTKVLADVRKRIEHAARHQLNEQNTKATLVEPVLRALGWDVEDVEEVVREFRVKKRDKPVDYGLLSLRKPRLFIEAKSLGSNLGDRRWANQIMGYASVAGVEWIVLTDGNEYRIYNTHAPVEVDQKLFRTVRVTDDVPVVQQTLDLLSKARLEENRIEVLWRAQFVDRQVHAALNELLSADSDMLLINFIMGKSKNLSADEIRDSLWRCRLTLDFPLLLEVPPGAPPRRRTTKKPASAQHGKRMVPKSFDATLQDLIAAGLLAPSTSLKRNYKGQVLTATVERDGRVKFGSTSYESPSQAAGAARASVVGLGASGKLPPTNGWTFWETKGQDGKSRTLAEIRAQFLMGREAEASHRPASKGRVRK